MSTPCPKCNAPLLKPFACAACDWRAPPANAFELTPGAPQVKSLRDMTPAERQQARELAQVHLDRIKALLAVPKPNAGTMSHVLTVASKALAGIDQDPEAIAERDAIVREWGGKR